MGVWDRYYERKQRASVPRSLTAPFSQAILTIVTRAVSLPPVARILEIGGGEGSYLALFSKSLNAMPSTIELSEVGAAQCRETLQRMDMRAEEVLHGDVFDPTLQLKWKERFDFVCSFGFVEHFADIRRTLAAHTNLVKPGGFCFVTVPNFHNPYNRGFCLMAKGRREYDGISINEAITLSSLEAEFGSLGMRPVDSGYLKAWPLYRPVSFGRALAISPMLALGLCGNLLGLPTPHALGPTMFVLSEKSR